MSNIKRNSPFRSTRAFKSYLHTERLEDRLTPAVLDLTTLGASGSLNGAFFVQYNPDTAAGTGLIDSFLRLQNKGEEKGYNTDSPNHQFDEKGGNFTRALLLSDVPTVTFNGQTYREFALDINEPTPTSLLSLDALRFYVSNSNVLDNYDLTTNKLNGLAPVYDLGSNSVKLDESLSGSGSGREDMLLFVPNNLFPSTVNGSPTYVYLFSDFGATVSAQGGFEEWAVGKGGPLQQGIDLAVTKTDGVTSVDAGGSTTYTITVTNNSSTPVSNALVDDVLPAGISSDTWTASASSGSSVANTSGTGAIHTTVDLAPCGTVTFLVSAKISGSASGSITNTATVSPPIGTVDTNPSDNTALDTDTINAAVTPRVDLSITKSDGVTSVNAGATTVYTIVVSNNSSVNVTGANVVDTLPSAIASATWTAVASTGSSVASASGSGSINTTVNLLAGGTVTFTLTAKVGSSATGSFTNTSTVTPPSSVIDTNPGNNTASDTDTINVSGTPTIDLAITKTDGVTSVNAGSTTVYTITVSNNSSVSVTGAQIADVFPSAIASATWTAATSAGSSVAATSGTGNINTTANLLAGGTLTFTVSAAIDASATGSFTNTATVAPPAGVVDTNPGSNSASDTDTINATGSATVDLAITKTDGVTSVNAGATTIYTIVVSNNSSVNVTGAQIADVFPTAISSSTWTAVASAGSAIAATTGTGDIHTTADLLAGGSVTFTVTSKISSAASGSFTNTTTVLPPVGVIDVNLSNNTASDTDTITPSGPASVDLAISKTDGVTSVTAGSTTVYTIIVSNSSSVSVTGAQIADVFPSAIAGAAWTAAASAGSSVANASGVGDIHTTANLLPGGTITFTATATVSSTASGPFTNMATVTPPAGVVDTNLSNNVAIDTDTIIPSVGAPNVDLIISKSDGVTSVTPGSTTVYTITVFNSSTITVNGASIVDNLPAGIASATWTAEASAGSSVANVAGSGNINTTAHLAPSGSITFTVTAQISPFAAGQVVNAAVVTAPAGVTETNPNNNVAVDIDVVSAPTGSLASIGGTKFQDNNANGTRDAGEPGLSGVTIFLDANGNGILDAGEISTTTGTDGNFSFSNLSAGAYTVREVTQPSWTQITANPAAITVSGSQVISNVNFGNAQFPSISGTKFEDMNANGVMDAGEPGIPGVTVYLDLNNNSALDTGEPSAVTSAGGSWHIDNVRPGITYQVREIVPDGWRQSTPNPAPITVVSGQFVANVNFGNLPTGSLLASSGSRNPLLPFAPLTGQQASLIVPISKTQLIGSTLMSNLSGVTQSEANFVNGLYQNLLGRMPDQGGLTFWVQAMQNGASRTQVATSFWESSEHRVLEVDQFYQTFLHRAADAAGQQFWVNAFASGSTEVDVMRGFLLSPEYQNSHSDSVSFVNGLYMDVLGRASDAGGQSFWLQALANGTSRTSAAQSFLTADEARLRVLDTFYTGLLGRAADSDGLAFWLAQLKNGRSIESVGAAFLASDEYFARVNRA